MDAPLRRTRPRRILAGLLALVALAAGACTATIPNQDPTGSPFPAVRGADLGGQPVDLPADLAGRPAVLLLGYVQKAQFDADRWLFGLLQAETPVQVREVPTMRGMVPRLIANRIDSGMRRGIPSEDWASVVTVYGDEARRIVEFTGDDNPRNMRVVLLDGDGEVVWFHDRGFSAAKLLELDRLARGL